MSDVRIKLSRDQITARDHFRKEALRIAQDYEKHCAEHEAQPHKIGDRRVVRNPIPPRFKPASLLKRQIYGLACEIDDKRALEVLISHVRARDKFWNLIHRPRQATVIDWTLRLVRGRLTGKPTALGVKEPIFLFDDTTLSRFAIELNFAFRHQIKADYITMFIDDLGGHEIISARLAEGGYDLGGDEWLTDLRRRVRPSRVFDDDDDDDDKNWNEGTNQSKTDKSKIGDVGAEKAGRNDSSLKHLKRSVVPQGDADDEWN